MKAFHQKLQVAREHALGELARALLHHAEVGVVEAHDVEAPALAAAPARSSSMRSAGIAFQRRSVTIGEQQKVHGSGQP